MTSWRGWFQLRSCPAGQSPLGGAKRGPSFAKLRTASGLGIRQAKRGGGVIPLLPEEGLGVVGEYLFVIPTSVEGSLVFIG